MSMGMAKTKKKELMVERLKVLTDIADALVYMHDKNIIHRDLKPKNFAFDSNGNIKIIDFGLSRILPTCGANISCSARTQDETYHLTGNTGTMRYMAPEVALNRRYNAKADVYSLVIIIYNTMSLKKAFEGFSFSQMKNQVFIQAKRPSFSFSSKTWPVGIRKLIEDGWSQQIVTRSTAKAVHHSLKHVLRSEEHQLSLSSETIFASCYDALAKTQLSKGWSDLGLSTRNGSRGIYDHINTIKKEKDSIFAGRPRLY